MYLVSATAPKRLIVFLCIYLAPSQKVWRYMDGRTDRWTDRQTVTDGQTDGRTDGQKDGRTDELTDRQKARQTDGQGDSYFYLFINPHPRGCAGVRIGTRFLHPSCFEYAIRNNVEILHTSCFEYNKEILLSKEDTIRILNQTTVK
jgi:hypothetical protein